MGLLGAWHAVSGPWMPATSPPLLFIPRSPSQHKPIAWTGFNTLFLPPQLHIHRKYPYLAFPSTCCLHPYSREVSPEWNVAS